MGDTSETIRTSTGMENLSLQMNRFPRDLLQRFMGIDSKQSEFGDLKEEDSEEIELNLGLSLGGRFGVDKSDKKLMRSSSVASSFPIIRDDDAVAPPPVAYPSLVRTSSLPVEMEEEWRKRKELQTLRRMEAKRRRSEKQKNKDSGGCGGGCDGGGGEGRREIRLNLRGQGGNRFGFVPTPPPAGLPTWAAGAKQAVFSGGIDVGIAKGMGNHVSGGGNGGGGGCMQGFGQPASQVSMESQGGSSSSMSELESKHLQGSSSCGEVSPGSIQSLQEPSNQGVIGSSGAKTREITRTEIESSSRRADVSGSKGKEIGTNSIEDMPCVFTVGDGPNGRKVDGILYKYGKGEEVRIMCVCHGSFLSPAEFVKHAGGSDVAHPLKHIVVNPNSPSFL